MGNVPIQFDLIISESDLSGNTQNAGRRTGRPAKRGNGLLGSVLHVQEGLQLVDQLSTDGFQTGLSSLLMEVSDDLLGVVAAQRKAQLQFYRNQHHPA